MMKFTVDEEELVIILESSGTGKSTLPNLLGGLDSVTSGRLKALLLMRFQNRLLI